MTDKVRKILDIVESVAEYKQNIYKNSYQIKDALFDMGIKDVKIFNGCSKICIDFLNEDFVIKFTPLYRCHEDDVSYNESVQEANIYTFAKSYGCEVFFPATKVLEQCNDIIYILQEKVNVSYGDYKYYPEKHTDISKSLATVDSVEFPLDILNLADAFNLEKTWVKAAYAMYGKNTLLNFFTFIEEMQINDLHQFNIGFRNCKPVVLDFSGYKRSVNKENNSVEYLFESESFELV